MLRKINKKHFLSDIAIIIYLALITIIVHIIISGNYGYFLDELYTIACSKHLSLGFVDIPPVAPALLALNTAIFGNSLIAIHILPSIFSGLVVIIIGLMVKELGGGKFAIFVAGLATVFVPVWMAVGTLYTYDFLDQFIIILLLYTVLILLKKENLKIWITIGLIAGIGLMTKPSMIFFIFGLFLAVLMTKHRKQFLTPWPWLGGLVVIIIILPALIWQANNGFPIAEYWQSYSQGKAVHANPLEFIIMQVAGMNISLLPIWIAGIFYFFKNENGKKYKLFGILYAVLFIIFLLTGAKMYMLIPAYSILIVGGSIAFENLNKRKWKVIKPAYIAIIIILGIIQAPNFMPILPIDGIVKYYDVVGGLTGTKTIKLSNDNDKIDLPQYFYDRLEWDVLINDVTSVYMSLTESERADTAILTQNYGWAGAIDLFGEGKGLPKATCGQLNYYLFGIDNIGKGTMIIIGESQEELSKIFGQVTLAKTSETIYRKPNKIDIFICKEPKFSTEEARKMIKKFE